MVNLDANNNQLDRLVRADTSIPLSLRNKLDALAAECRVSRSKLIAEILDAQLRSKKLARILASPKIPSLNRNAYHKLGKSLDLLCDCLNNPTLNWQESSENKLLLQCLSEDIRALQLLLLGLGDANQNPRR